MHVDDSACNLASLNLMKFRRADGSFDTADFDAVGTTFMVDDWLSHTPLDIVAKNFGLPESAFNKLPEDDPYIFNTTVSDEDVGGGPAGQLTGNSSYVFHLAQGGFHDVPGGGGTFRTVDSTNFPISETIAAAIVTLKPKGLRELHWHPNAEEWLYFHQGTARATVFMGGATSRTFDFRGGDVGVFPDNSGHYIENTSETEDLIWLELYKSDRVADISLTQWLALTPADIVAATLKLPLETVQNLKKEKQILLKGN